MTTTLIITCTICGATYSSLAWSDPQKAYDAHRQNGPKKCRPR